MAPKLAAEAVKPAAWVREGEARATRAEAPPPLLAAEAPVDAAGKLAAEDASCEPADDAMVLARAELGSWLEWACCAPCEGENGEVVDEMEELRLMFCRAEGGIEDDGCVEADGGNELLEGLWADVDGGSRPVEELDDGRAVEIGGGPRRDGLEDPQANCWLI